MKILFLPCLFMIAIAAFAQTEAAVSGSEEAARETSSQSPRELTSSDHYVSTVPMFSASGKIRCDNSGRIFLFAGSMLSEDGSYIALSDHGQRHTVFTLPATQDTPDNTVWAISPAGKLYVLQGNFHNYKLLRFKDDGTVDRTTSLSLPSRINLTKMAITEGEVLYLEGYYVTQENPTHPERGFAALVNSSGQLFRDLSAIAPDVNLQEARTHLPEGDVIAAENGRFYILSSDRVTALSQSGEISSAIKFTKPYEASRASLIQYSQGILSVVFHTVQPHVASRATAIQSTAMQINALNGDVVSYYNFLPPLTGTVLCFSASDGYTLLSVDHRMIALDEVPIR